DADVEDSGGHALLRAQRLLNRREYASRIFRKSRCQIRTYGAEQIIVTIRPGILFRQRFVDLGSAGLVPLARERLGPIDGWGKLSLLGHTGAARQNECRRGDHSAADDPSR